MTVVAVVFSLLLHAAVIASTCILGHPIANAKHSDILDNSAIFQTRALATSEPSSSTIGLSHTGPELVPETPTSRTSPQNGLATQRSLNRFYTVTEVDQAATPFADWLVPWELLKEAQVQEFVVQLWIDESGKILKADVLQVTPVAVSQDTKDQLSRWLARTQTSPALKDGRPVASVRIIEVTLDL